jgi:hypothetical protein
MAYDVVRPLKLESSARGGVQNDYAPKEMDACQDALPTVAVLLQDPTTVVVDQRVAVTRTGTSLQLTDASTSRSLRELVTSVSGQPNAHNALADIIHYLADGGPGDGTPSGAVQTAGYAGPLLTSTVWWTSAAQTQRIYSVVWSYSGPLVSTATYTLYDAKGAQVRQMVDSFAYNGPLCTSVTRTWS